MSKIIQLSHTLANVGLICILALMIGQLLSCNSKESALDITGHSDDSLKHPEANLEVPTESLPIPLRLAFMTGHVRAGIALYRAGELKMAAPHLLHPVSETHRAERKGLEKLGFNSSPFNRVSLALEANRPAIEIEPLLAEAEANLLIMESNAGGDKVSIIKFLLTSIADEYSLSMKDGELTDIGEYQDAYGFNQVAIEHARELPENIRGDIVTALQALEELWLQGPVPLDNPTPEMIVIDAVNVILEKLQ